MSENSGARLAPFPTPVTLANKMLWQAMSRHYGNIAEMILGHPHHSPFSPAWCGVNFPFVSVTTHRILLVVTQAVPKTPTFHGRDTLLHKGDRGCQVAAQGDRHPHTSLSAGTCGDGWLVAGG